MSKTILLLFALAIAAAAASPIAPRALAECDAKQALPCANHTGWTCCCTKHVLNPFGKECETATCCHETEECVANGGIIESSHCQRKPLPPSEPFGTWSTANLSEARCELAATSLPYHGLAIFAGGNNNSCSRFCPSNVVDIFDATTRTWSTAALSEARFYLVAACLPVQGLAIFAGGAIAGNQDASLWTPSKVVDIFNATAGTWSVANLSEARVFLAAASLPNHGLAIFAGGIVLRNDMEVYSNIVDIFNATAGTWRTANLSEARWHLAATSLPNYGLAIFASGQGDLGLSNVVDIYNATTGTWSTAFLSAARWFLVATSLPNQGLAMFAGGTGGGQPFSNAVDIFNATAGTWSTAALSKARSFFVATSLPDQGLAMFAGGSGDDNYPAFDPT